MNVIEALNARFSARAYKSQPVSRETLEKVMEAGLRAPSWANTQPWELYVVSGEPLERLRAAFGERLDKEVPSNFDIPRPTSWPAPIQQRMAAARRPAPATPPSEEEMKKAPAPPRPARLFGAPVVIYLCMDRSLTAYSVYDLGLVSQSIMLAAKEHGLDTIVAVSLVAYPDLIRQELAIPDELQIVLGIALGYADPDAPANQRPKSARRPLEDAVHFHGI